MRRHPFGVLLLVIATLTCTIAVATFPPSRPTLESELIRFLHDEKIGGAVIAYGAVGASPTILAVGNAAPDRKMRPNDRFHLASLSKPITAAAVLKLVEEKRISLDTPVPEAGPGITVRHLLQHSGGWNRNLRFDPISDPSTARKIGIALPYRYEDVATRMPPAEFRPGTQYAYSNIGYCWLGKVIERTAHLPYHLYVQRYILAPRKAALVYNGLPTVRYTSNWPDAAYQALGPAGGWTGTAGDYWSFAAGPLDPHVTERPAYALSGQNYYGLGWRVWPDGTLSHFGAIPGIYTILIRRNGHVAVLLFNGRPANDEQAFQRLRALIRTVGA